MEARARVSTLVSCQLATNRPIDAKKRKDSVTQLRTLIPVLVAALTLSGCADEPHVAPLTVEVRALGSGECAPGSIDLVDPFTDMTTAQIIVRGIDPVDGVYKVLVNEKKPISGGSIQIVDVPEGHGHDVEFIGTGGSVKWYAKDPSVSVKRDQGNPVELLLTRFGGFSQVPVDTSFTNVIFPAMVELGDGRVMISGGFQNVLGGGSTLGSPSKQFFIYNQKTGDIDTKGSLPDEGRGAHGMVFLPTTNQVLIFGGATELSINDNGLFPLTYEKSKGEKQSILYNVPTFEEPNGSFEAVNIEHVMKLARVFPQGVVLSDGLVAISGGGEWPQDSDSDYLQVEVFDPGANEGTGDFLKLNSFKSFATRTGHTVNFIKTHSGMNYYLFYGGTTSDQQIAEVMRQSPFQTDGVDGHFMELTIEGDAPAYTYFHQMTALSGMRFLATGGVRYDKASQTLSAPADDEAYLLTYSDVDGQNPKLRIEKVAGMTTGRVFHAAVTTDGRNVAVVGGFSGIDAVDANKIMFFDADATADAWEIAAENTDFLARGGQGSLMQKSGTVLLVGGETNLKSQGSVSCGYVELYTPSNIPIP